MNGPQLFSVTLCSYVVYLFNVNLDTCFVYLRLASVRVCVSSSGLADIPAAVFYNTEQDSQLNVYEELSGDLLFWID